MHAHCELLSENFKVVSTGKMGGGENKARECDREIVRKDECEKLEQSSHRERKLLLQCPFYNGGWQSAEAELFLIHYKNKWLSVPC